MVAVVMKGGETGGGGVSCVVPVVGRTLARYLCNPWPVLKTPATQNSRLRTTPFDVCISIICTYPALGDVVHPLPLIHFPCAEIQVPAGTVLLIVVPVAFEAVSVG